MPKRTNEFQRLIVLIEKMLADTGWTVTESKMVLDSATGEEVEIDIAIEGSPGGHPTLKAIECTARKRKATVEWIYMLIGKYSTLQPVDAVLAVSKSGFTPGAIRKAKMSKVRVATYEEVANGDWLSDFFGDDSLYRVVSHIWQLVEIGIVVPIRGHSTESIDTDIADCELFSADGLSYGRIKDIAPKLVEEKTVRDKLASQATQKVQSGSLEITASLRAGCYIITPDEQRFPATQLIVKATSKAQVVPLDLKRAVYRDVPIATGDAESVGSPIQVVLTRRPEEPLKIGIT